MLRTERNGSGKEKGSLGPQCIVILGDMKATMSDLSGRCQSTEDEFYEKI